MKRSFLFVALFCMAELFVFSNPTFSSDWDIRKPVDTPDYHYVIGISEPCITEKQAVSGAWYNLLASFASSISTFVTVNTDETIFEEGFESEVLDTYTITLSHSNWKSQVPLYGIQQLEKKIEKDSDGMYVVKILGCMSSSDYEKSRIAVFDEETCSNAYLFFQEKLAEDFLQKSESTYTKWVRLNCAILEFTVNSESERFASLTEKFLSKLYRNAVFYRCSFEGFSSIMIYNHPDYFETTLRALENTGCFNFEQNGSVIKVSNKKENSYSDFLSFCNNMKDSKKISVFGSESFCLPSGMTFTNSENRSVQKFSDFAQKKFGMSVQKSSLTFATFEEMKEYVTEHKKDFPSRYFAFCTSETNYEEFGNKAWVNASVSFMLFDLESGEEWASAEASSMPMSAVITAVTDEQVKAKSRIAIDNACNPDKNPENILVIMQEIFNQLP
ncbi:MAG: hypothetical protein IJ688_09275 [Treponema sp.]|nr:hypothetical protein [Treponema sp.]